MIYFQLFYEFLKIGLFAVGGGLATIPFLQNLSVRSGWFSQSELLDVIAVSESTPGPIGINMATYAGYKTAGLPGGIIAPLSLILPSVIVVIIISRFLRKFRENKYVNGAFYGLRPASTALITSSMSTVLLSSIYAPGSGLNTVAVIIYAAVTGFCFFADNKKFAHPLFVILAGIIIGVIFKDYL